MLERSLVISSVIDLLANCCLSLHSALGPTGELRHIVFIQYNWGGDTISTRCVFNRTGVMVSRDGKIRKQQERADCGSGLIPSQDDDPPPPTPAQPSCIHQELIDSSYLLQNCLDQTQSMPPSLMPKISIFCTFSLGHRRNLTKSGRIV